jgi:Protein of unknown function (DUF3617)
VAERLIAGRRRPRRRMLQAALGCTAAAMLAGIAPAAQGEALLQEGAYEVEVRLELPNVLSRRPDSTTTICLPYRGTNGALPVLSANNPLARCPVSNVEREGAVLRFDILCEGRGAAFAHAVYKLMPEAFEGRIAMVMGGKNMTMTEVQSGRRIGRCHPTAVPRS